MPVFACDLLIIGVSKQFLDNAYAFATRGILPTRNGIVASDYLQECTLSSGIDYHTSCPSNQMKACEILRLMVKTV